MFVFGTRVIARPSALGEFDCPRCRAAQPYQRYTHRPWFTLYFLPVLPIGSRSEEVVCQSCRSRFEPNVLQDPAAAHGVIEATLPDNAAPLAAPPSIRSKPTSSLAIASLVFALLSPALLCVCGLSLVTSLVAIVSGHLSLIRIKQASDHLSGRGLAISGLVVGYSMLLISIAVLWVILPGLRQGWQAAELARPNSSEPLDASARLRSAETEVLAVGGEGAATGNSASAQALAADFSDSMKDMRDALFTAGKKPILSFTKGEFVTHCEISPGRCAFIVHVPDYRKFDSDAKDSLELISWRVAQQSAAEVMKPGDQLAVGLRGTVLYGAVMVGKVADADEPSAEMQELDRDALLAFFEPAPTVENSIPLPVNPQPLATRESPRQPVDSPPKGAASSRPPTPAFETNAPAVKETPSIPREAVDASGSTARRQRSNVPFTPSAVDAGRREKSVETQSTGNVSPTPELRPSNDRERAPSSDVVCTFPEMGWTVKSLAIAPNGRWLAVGKMDRKILLLDIDRCETIAELDGLEELGQVEQIAFSPDGRFLAAAGYSGAIIRWRVSDRGELSEPLSLNRHSKQVGSLRFSPAAPFLISGGSDGVLLWQSFSSGTLQSRNKKVLPRKVVAIHLPDQGLEATATDGNELIRINLKTAAVEPSVELRRGSTRSASFSGDGSRLAIATGRAIEVYDVPSGGKVQTLDAKRETQWTVRFFPDGQRLISGGRGQATLWDLASGTAVDRFDLGGVSYIQTVAISGDGSTLAAIPASAGQTLTLLRIPEK